MDVLRQVPGFEFAGDIENIIGLGLRGNYTLEGRVLVLIDGHEINETNYGSVIFGGRFFTDNIKKIEIIRGPGSSIYGGMAQLGVINITTKKADDLENGYGSFVYGNSNELTSRTTGQFGVGKTFGEDLKLSFTGSLGVTNRSNEMASYATNYDSEDGESVTINYADSSEIKNTDLNFNASYKGLELSAMYQKNLVQIPAGYADYLKVGGLYLSTKYNWEVNDKLTIKPSVNWKVEDPWTYQGNLGEDARELMTRNQRMRNKLIGDYKFSEKVLLTAGGEYQHDLIRSIDELAVFSDGRDEVTYSNLAAFGELSYFSSFANIILGARIDNHSQFGEAFSPRIAITKVINNFHVKLLASGAFKAPLFYNIEANPDILPERAQVAEIELGYLINDHISVLGNVFMNKVEDPIIYFIDNESGEETYFNDEVLSTVGFESILKFKYDWGTINTSYSFYANEGSNVEAYQVEDDDRLLRGFPAHKLALNANFNVSDKLRIGTSYVFNSQKVGYYYAEEFWENYVSETFPSSHIVNLTANYDITKKIGFSLGVYDLLDDNFLPVNAYDAGYYATPILGREITAKLNVNF